MSTEPAVAAAPAPFPLRRPNHQDHDYLEKRQAFLRSYHLGRPTAGGGWGKKEKKMTAIERIRRWLQRARRAIIKGMRAVRRARRLVWWGLRRRAGLAVKRVSCCGGGNDVVGTTRDDPITAREWFGTPSYSHCRQKH